MPPLRRLLLLQTPPPPHTRWPHLTPIPFGLAPTFSNTRPLKAITRPHLFLLDDYSVAAHN